uniref:Early endosome antigen 1 n=1 Tax=Astyanax mexicanus TaxID=7994 RepID=A0A8B9JW77_ASTMX
MRWRYLSQTDPSPPLSIYCSSSHRPLLSISQTPGKGGSQASESEQPSADMNNETSEGFICPQCMKSHNSAEELFKHYEVYHEPQEQPSHLSPGRDDLALLRREVQDLQASLKEERWFSEELKKELDKAQGQLNFEVEIHDLDILFSELEMKLHEAETEKFNIKQMKDLFEQKAAQLATEIVDIKSRYDEEKSHREVAEQRLASVQQDLQKERQEKDRLATELLQRPGVEDVDVLKKELVQVQTLMDNMTREREEESERLKNQYEQLQVNFTNSETTIAQLKAELEKGPQEAAVYTQQIHQLQSNLNNLQQQSQLLSEKLARKEKENQELEERLGQEQASKKNLQGSLHQRELELQEVQARASAGESSLGRTQAELTERGEEAARLRRELAELERSYQELKAERKQLHQQKEEKESQGLQQQSEISQLHAKLLETERQLGEVQGRLKEQRQLSGEKLKDREQQAAELQLKLSRLDEQLKESATKSTDLQHQLEKSKQQHQEVQALQQSTNCKLREAQNDLEQVLRQIGDKDQKIQNLEALLQKSKASLSQLEAEREDLCAKIQAGEGEAALLNQLQEKNHMLQEQITQFTDKLKNQSESHKQAQENLHEQLQEQKSQLRSAHDRCQGLERTVTDLTAQLTQSKERLAQLDTQLKAKTEMLLSAEAAKNAQRADLENHLETAQNALQDKQQELSKVQAQLEEQGCRMQEKQEQCSQLETSLKESRDKLLAAEQKTDTLESQIKVSCTENPNSTFLLSRNGNLAQNCHSLLVAASLQEEVQKKSSALADTKKQLEAVEKNRSGLQTSLDQLTKEGKAQQAELEKKLQGQSVELQKVQQERDTQGKELTSVKEALSKTSATLKESQTQLEKAKKNSAAALEEKVEELTKLKEQMTGLSKELSSEKSRCAEVQKTCDSTKETLTKLQSDYYGKESEVSAMRQDLKLVFFCVEELVASTNQLNNRDAQIQDLKAARAALEKDLGKRDEKLKQQEEAIRQLQKQQVPEQLKKEHSQVEEMREAQSALEKDRSKLSAELKALADKSEKEVKELQAAKQLLLQQKVDLQGKVEAAQATLEQEKREHQTTRDSIQQTQQQHKAETDKLQKQLALEVKAKEEVDKRREDAEAKLTMQVSALNENVATLKREWQGSQRRVGELEKQTDELRGEIAVLEATVQNNQDERRALLERCVKGEGEIEKLQGKVVEMRRKLDDTTAAMQELGRENQSLQIKQSQSLTRKWAEDNEVQNCMSCGKGFSVTIRKHHCRHCGNIFCAECSARNALTPSSKKPVRVCEACFEELQG